MSAGVRVQIDHRQVLLDEAQMIKYGFEDLRAAAVSPQPNFFAHYDWVQRAGITRTFRDFRGSLNGDGPLL